MASEMDALLWNDTWSLVPYDSSLNILGCKWVFRVTKKFFRCDRALQGSLSCKEISPTGGS